MNTLPIQLNFFRRAEQFLELLNLDEQYSRMMREWNSEVKRALIEGREPNRIIPTWNIEKKILQWTYLNHKHLGTPLNTGFFKIKQYLDDWNTNIVEAESCGPKQILENLVAHGFARNCDNQQGVQILITSNGLLAGSLLNDAYYLRKAKNVINGANYLELSPRTLKNIGYHFLYFAAWALIIVSIALISTQLLSVIGLIDDAKRMFGYEKSNIVQIVTVYAVFSPLVLLLLGILFLRIIPTRKGTTPKID